MLIEGGPALHLSTPVDAAYLDRVQAQLQPILYARQLAHRQRYIFPRLTVRLLATARLLSASGLLLALSMQWFGNPQFHGMPLNLLFAAFFASMLAWLWHPQRLAQRISTPSPRFWNRIARSRTTTLLMRARKRAPFLAEYELRGDMAVYFRTSAARADVAWTRRLAGYRLAADGFTLLFKKAGAPNPYAIILHAPADQLDGYLDALGVAALTDVVPAA